MASQSLIKYTALVGALNSAVHALYRNVKVISGGYTVSVCFRTAILDKGLELHERSVMPSTVRT